MKKSQTFRDALDRRTRKASETGILDEVNDACSYLSTVLPGITFEKETRMAIAITLENNGVRPATVAEVAFELPDREWAVENARYLRTIPPSDWVKCAEEIRAPDPGDTVEPQVRRRMLDAGWTPSDFKVGQRLGPGGQVTEYVYVSDEHDERPSFIKA